MARRILSALLGGSIVLGSFSTVPALGKVPKKIPKVVQIKDPAGDANYLNGQGTPGQGDRTTPADLSVSDVLSTWFTNDAKTISVNVQTELPPPSANASYLYRVMFNPSGDRPSGCLWFEVAVEGPGNLGNPFARLRDVCTDAEFQADSTISEAANGTGIITVTVARSVGSAFRNGAFIRRPWVEVRNIWGPEGDRKYVPVVDDTKIGKNYRIRRPRKAAG